MHVVASEEICLDEEPPPPIDLISLRNQYSTTSVQSDISSFNTEGVDSSSDYLSNRVSEAFDDTWKDVGGTDSDRNTTNTEKFDTTGKSLRQHIDDLDDIIFLSPYWLLQSMKKILTHHLEDDISKIA